MLHTASPPHDPGFAPQGWLTHRHVQTLLAAAPVWRRVPVGTRHEHLVLPLPGGAGSLHARAFWQPRQAPAVLLIHGVGGSCDSAYVQRAAHAVAHAGYHAVCLDLRGSGRGTLLANTLYHAGLTSDVDAVVGQLAERPAILGLAVMGLSLGGQTALLAAARWGDRAPAKVRAVVSVSAPYDLEASCRRLDDGPLWAYRGYILRGLVARALVLARRVPEQVPLTPKALTRLRRIWDYDDQVIAPMHQFASAADYYRAVSCGPHLSAVRIPTLCIHAEDDPIVPVDTLAPFIAEASPAIAMRWSRYGGHLGFAGTLAQRSANWAFHTAVAFLRQHATP